MRVIVVEDNVLFCNYICNFLQKADLDTVMIMRKITIPKKGLKKNYHVPPIS